MKKSKRKVVGSSVITLLKDEIQEVRGREGALAKLKQEVGQLTVLDFDRLAEQTQVRGMQIDWEKLFQKYSLILLHKLTMIIEFDDDDRQSARAIGNLLQSLIEDINRLIQERSGNIHPRIRKWSVNLLKSYFKLAPPEFSQKQERSVR